jgi:hypothetical protein
MPTGQPTMPVRDRQTLVALNRVHGLSVRYLPIAALFCLVWAVTACGDGDSEARESPSVPPASVSTKATGSPTIEAIRPTSTVSPEVVDCPVDGDTCAHALQIAEAWSSGDLDGLMALKRPISAKCPVPRPAGLGGPYPLCEDAAVDGELRTGFLWSSGTHGGLKDESALREGLQELLRLDMKLVTIGCFDSGQKNCEGDFVLAFGVARFGTIEVVYDVPVFVDGDGFGLVGALPRTIYNCSDAPQPPCERVLGGTATAPDYRSWGVEDTPALSPDWTFYRWTPF